MNPLQFQAITLTTTMAQNLKQFAPYIIGNAGTFKEALVDFLAYQKLTQEEKIRYDHLHSRS